MRTRLLCLLFLFLWMETGLFAARNVRLRYESISIPQGFSTPEIYCTFQDKEGYEQIVDDVPRIIRNRAITYAEGFDKICFVVDCDRESFVAHEENNQYKYVLEKCRENGFGLYLTNPCFEFWLLIHFDDVEQLDEIQLFHNPKITAKRRYTEQELRKRMTGYTKSSYDVDWFMNRIDIAIKNEKNYCRIGTFSGKPGWIVN